MDGWLRRYSTNRLSSGYNVDDGQWICAYRNAKLKSYLVSSSISSAPDMVGLSFLLGAQAVTCPVPLKKSALSTSSQREHWPMVWIIHASS